jgi:hypothetical protein
MYALLLDKESSSISQENSCAEKKSAAHICDL